MKRVFEKFVEKTNKVVSFSNAHILEIGCGDGNYSKQIAKYASKLEAIDPDDLSIQKANKNIDLSNITFRVSSALNLPFDNNVFDIVLFTLSLHHVPKNKMHEAIKEAVRVTKQSGHIIFLEPAMEGSFFDAEILFDACDGDERDEKKIAYKAIIESKLITQIDELKDKTVFTFTSTEDFVKALAPKQKIEKISDFLAQHNMILEAKRRINICTPVK